MFTAAETKISLEDAGFTARETAMTFALCQWGLLHGKDRMAHKAALQSFVDPEALFLMSLSFQHIERKLSNELNWLIQRGLHLINFKRLKSMVRLFPPATQARLGTYAYVEWHQQRPEAKNRSLAVLKPEHVITTTQSTPDLSLNQALMLRLRAGFGATTETDILACIIGSNNKEITAEEIAQLTGNSLDIIKQKLSFMVLSRFIKAVQGNDKTAFLANSAFATSLLKKPASTTASSPRLQWLSWMHIYAFLAQVESFTRTEKITDIKPYVLSKKAGQVITNNMQVFSLHGLDIEDPTLGTDYLKTFNASVRKLTSWLVTDQAGLD